MTCILCARRGKTTRSEGHVCVPCAAWLQVQVADILRLAADAAAYVAPGSSTGGGSRPVPGSRPPLRVDALDPELTPVPVPGQPPHVWPTVLQICESWERLCREMRDMVPYGPASAARARAAARNGQGAPIRTDTTLAGCVAFLGRQVAWMSTEPDWPIEDFADEITACVRVLRCWDITAEERGTMVRCPTLTDDGECGYRLSYRDMGEPVTCRRCGVTRDAATLVAVALADPDSDAWADPEAIARQFGIHDSTLRKWSRSGAIPKPKHGLYSVTAVANVIHGATA